MIGRRALLGRVAGSAAAALALGACRDDANPRPVDPTIVSDPTKLEGDLAAAALLASMDNLLVAVYQECIDRRDRLGPYPLTVLALIETAQRQHRDHVAAWNAILTGAGKRPVTGVNLTVKAATTDPSFFRARDTTSVLTIAQEIENVTAATYLAAIGGMNNLAAIKVAASIHPVECQHLSVLTFLLGRAMPSESFARSDNLARPLTDNIG